MVNNTFLCLGVEEVPIVTVVSLTLCAPLSIRTTHISTMHVCLVDLFITQHVSHVKAQIVRVALCLVLLKDTLCCFHKDIIFVITIGTVDCHMLISCIKQELTWNKGLDPILNIREPVRLTNL